MCCFSRFSFCCGRLVMDRTNKTSSHRSCAVSPCFRSVVVALLWIEQTKQVHVLFLLAIQFMATYPHISLKDIGTKEKQHGKERRNIFSMKQLIWCFLSSLYVGHSLQNLLMEAQIQCPGWSYTSKSKGPWIKNVIDICNKKETTQMPMACLELYIITVLQMSKTEFLAIWQD